MPTTWDDLRRPGAATDFFARHTMPAFDPAATSFHLGNAIWLAELSRIVYRRDVQEQVPAPQPERTRFLDAVGLHTIGFFAHAKVGAQALLVQSSSQQPFAVLAFRGTEQTPADYYTDIDMGLQSLSKDSIGVHQGFNRALNAVWPEIEASLSTLRCPIFYTGHSLGAALATLAAARRTPQAVYAYGSPRVGNALFAQSVRGQRIYRLVHGSDLVTTMPPELLGFQHVGEQHHLPRDTSDATGSWQARLKQLGGPPGPLADHAPIHYTDRLAARARP